MSALLFREGETEDSALHTQPTLYPRKKARLQFVQPMDRIRDLKLPKKLELEKRKVYSIHAGYIYWKYFKSLFLDWIFNNYFLITTRGKKRFFRFRSY